MNTILCLHIFIFIWLIILTIYVINKKTYKLWNNDHTSYIEIEQNYYENKALNPILVQRDKYGKLLNLNLWNPLIWSGSNNIPSQSTELYAINFDTQKIVNENNRLNGILNNIKIQLKK